MTSSARLKARQKLGLACGLLVLLVLPSPGLCQVASPAPSTHSEGEILPLPRSVAPAPAVPNHGPEDGLQPIDLRTALRLALTSNLDIAVAREAIQRVRAVEERARFSFLPNATLGSTFSRHEGQIQKTEGIIIMANKESLFAGGGAAAAFNMSEAIFEPLVAQQQTVAAMAGLDRVTQHTLLAVADAYLNVLRYRRRLARVEETLAFLTSDQPAANRGNSKGLLPLLEQFVKSGAALPSDLERVRVEVLRRQEERAGALQDFRVAVAELARLVRLDPQLCLSPIEDFRYPLYLPGDEWACKPLDELVALALSNRPEVAENQAQVQAALKRVQEARFRPLLPNAAVSYSYGGFGGGPNSFKEGSGSIYHWRSRDDFDASLFFRLKNLGLGDRADLREQQALQQQATLRQIQVQDLVVTQVVQAKELVSGWHERLDITRAALFDDKGAPDGPVFKSLRLNFERIRGGEGRPLEVLDSIRGLSDLLEAYGQAATDYDRARFRLLFALGLTPKDLLDHWEASCSPDKAEAGPGPIHGSEPGK